MCIENPLEKIKMYICNHVEEDENKNDFFLSIHSCMHTISCYYHHYPCEAYILKPAEEMWETQSESSLNQNNLPNDKNPLDFEWA